MSDPPSDQPSAGVTSSAEPSIPASSGAMVRPSGFLKPPSKIGRPCQGQVHKPPVPLSPKGNGTNSSIQKLSDDLAKKRISLEEMEFPTSERRQSYERKFSKGSDSLWADLRKLSEAGVRRASDSSIVLTEDTDGFIIGDRVWVGGSKPGQIAYIGETQFAPGDWAGIVLDQPIGKNDGSVAGVRYFQCEPKKGIFSRLTRLTRKPLVLPEQESRSYVSPPSSVPSTPRTSVTTPMTPAPKLSVGHRGSISGASQSSAELKVGDRVIVMSSQGSKAGMLRYLGPTNFAVGEWCGVELDDPLGKNDGSVAGTRYFDCLPNFGLFAPMHKVSKSPAGGRKSSCAMHPPGSLKKHGSRESLSSVTTTASSIRSTASRIPGGVLKTGSTNGQSNKSPLQDMLREKQQHIEQLLKERDLERAEVTRAASQTEEAERKLADMKQEYQQLQEETDAKLEDMQLLMNRLQDEKLEVTSMLEDERRRSEDIQFRFEEETFAKAELQSAYEKNEEKLKELEQMDRTRIESLETESNKLFEAEEALTKLRDEFETLRQQAKSANDSGKALQELTELHEAKVKELDQELNRHKEDNKKLDELVKQLTETNKKNIELFEIDKKNLKEEINKLKVELQGSEKKCTEYTESINNIKLKLAETVENDNKQIEEINKKYKDEIESLNKQIKLAEDKMLESMNTIDKLNKEKQEDMRIIEEKLNKEKEEMITKEKLYNERLNEIENSSRQKLEQLEQESRSSKTEVELSLKKQIEDIQVEFSSKIQQLEGDKTDLNENIRILKTELDEKCKEKIKLEENNKENELELKNSNIKLEESITQLKEKQESEKQIHEDNVKKKDAEIDNLKVENSNRVQENEKICTDLRLLKETVDTKEETIKQISSNLTKLQIANDSKDQELEKCMVQSQSDNALLTTLKADKEAGLNKINEIELTVGDLNRQLSALQGKCSQLLEQKQKLEDDILNAMNSSTSSSEQLTKLSTDLRNKESEIEKLREQFAEENRLSQRNEQELQQKLDTQNRVSTELTSNINELKEQLANSQQQSAEKLENLTKQLNEQLEKSENETKQYNNTLKEKEDCCNKLKEEMKSNSEREKRQLSDLESENTSKLKKMEDEQKDLLTKLENMTAAETKLKEDYETATSNTGKLEGELLSTIKRLETESSDLRKQIDLSVEREKKLESFNDSNIKSIDEYKKKAESLQESLSIMTTEKSNAVDMVTSKTAEVNTLLKDLDLLKSDKLSLEQKLEESAKSLKNLSEELSNVKNDVVVKDNDITELRSKMEEKTAKLAAEKGSIESFEQKLKESEKTAKDVTEELNKIKICLTAKENDYIELKSRLEEEAAKLVADKENIQMSFGAKEGELKQLLAEVDKQKGEKENLEKQLLNRELQCNALNEKFEKLMSSLSEEKVKESELQEMMDRLKGELEKLRAEKKEQESKSAASVVDSADKMNKIQQQNVKLQEELNKHLERIKQDDAAIKLAQDQLTTLKKEMSATETKLKSSAKEQEEEFKKQLQTTVSRLEKSIEEEGKIKTTLEKSLDNYKAMLESKEKSILKLETEVKALRSEKEKNIVNNNNTAVGTANAASVTATNPVSAGDKGEMEMLHGQVAFLNSIIVDLQNKNETLKAQMQQIESGVMDAPTNMNGTVRRLPAPRLFCDICEIFDAHDTEDCPQQANESPPPEQTHPKYPRGFERPYCENCEEFGHDTAQCDDSEMF